MQCINARFKAALHMIHALHEAKIALLKSLHPEQGGVPETNVTSAFFQVVV